MSHLHCTVEWRTMNYSHEEMMAFMANDLFNKRQRLMLINQHRLQTVDALAAEALEAEYRSVEAEYLEAKAAFARAMTAAKNKQTIGTPPEEAALSR
jgi:hypothetical protein